VHDVVQLPETQNGAVPVQSAFVVQVVCEASGTHTDLVHVNPAVQLVEPPQPGRHWPLSQTSAPPHSLESVQTSAEAVQAPATQSSPLVQSVSFVQAHGPFDPPQTGFTGASLFASDPASVFASDLASESDLASPAASVFASSFASALASGFVLASWPPSFDPESTPASRVFVPVGTGGAFQYPSSVPHPDDPRLHRSSAGFAPLSLGGPCGCVHPAPVRV
jgi:hypothetical protein